MTQRSSIHPLCNFQSLHLVMLFWISSSAQGATAGLQVRRFMVAKMHATSIDAPGPEKTAEEDTHSSLQDPMKAKLDPMKAKFEKWAGQSAAPHAVATLVGTAWVLMLGSMPILVYKLDNRDLTKTGLALATMMWVALFGGLLLFTNTILFASPHFEHERSLTIIECTYFMTQIITTVGYGDITPAKFRGKIFVGLYVVLAFFVIALLVSEMQSVIVNRINKYRDHLEQKTGDWKDILEQKTGIHSQISLPSRSKSQSIVEFQPEKPSAASFLTTLSLFMLVSGVWILFFHYYPGEEKLWSDAAYMALVTLTTVGFGAVTPVTEGGMVFSAFFMIIGTASLVGVVTEFSGYVLELAAWESWNPKKFQEELMQLRNSLGGGREISELDFMTFTLVQKKILPKEEIDAIRQAYEDLKPKKGGCLTISSVASLAGVSRQEQVESGLDSGRGASETP